MFIAFRTNRGIEREISSALDGFRLSDRGASHLRALTGQEAEAVGILWPRYKLKIKFPGDKERKFVQRDIFFQM
jgi:hypothetical protein